MITQAHTYTRRRYMYITRSKRFWLNNFQNYPKVMLKLTFKSLKTKSRGRLRYLHFRPTNLIGKNQNYKSLWLKSHMSTVYYYHVTHAFQRESTLYSCLDVKELWLNGWVFVYKLSGCRFKSCCSNNHLVRKRTLNHLAKLAKWLSCAVSTYLYSAFDCMLSSCQVRVLEWIYTL